MTFSNYEKIMCILPMDRMFVGQREPESSNSKVDNFIPYFFGPLSKFIIFDCVQCA